MRNIECIDIEKYRKPILFYSLAIGIPWVLWFIAGYISHITPSNSFLKASASILGFIGLLSPVLIAYFMISSNIELKKDLKNRFFNFKTIKPAYIFATCFLMLTSILLAQAISLLFGYNINQFSLSHNFSFSAGIFPAWFLLFIAPVVEELAWHSYGTDCLRARCSLFTTSMVFATFWALWHIPLSFINDCYQSNVAETGFIYSLNFFLSIFPFVLLMNWLYYKANRNIIIPVILHLTAVFFNEIFSTHPDSKIIQTLILAALSIVLILKEHDFFFKRSYC
ncbi:MAG: amino terminal protease family [Firmicutes bacterium]|nr:amino terminal protease family [Bacillota bacterium]